MWLTDEISGPFNGKNNEKGIPTSNPRLPLKETMRERSA
jgi:hypothetical protein